MEFEYDPANKAKHGLDFEEAKALWDDVRMIEAPARTIDEPRYLAIGMIAAKHWAAVFSRRDGRVRLISVRRARDEEIGHYEGQ